tara:strand:- start:23346 stop:24455 length:1110 start_codon:yes stop_codon:yes gene_type:complete
MKLAKIRIDDMDQHYHGKEPEWVDAESLSDEDLEKRTSKALSWYGTIAKHRYNKKFLLEFCKTKKYSNDDTELYSRLSSRDISTSVSWLARMQSKGYVLNEEQAKKFNAEMQQLKEKASNFDEVNKNKNVISIQDRIEQKADREIAEIEYLLDQYVLVNRTFKFNWEAYLKSRDISSIIAEKISEFFVKEAKEVQDIIDVWTTDEYVREEWGHFTKSELKKWKSLLDDLITQSHMASQVKSVRKRKTKQKPAVQLVKNLNYASESDAYKSISPTKIIGAIQLWVYNVKTKKLGVYHAEDVRGLSVKGSTIQNFNATTSVSKTLRKPDDTIPTLLDAGKVKLRNILSELKTKEKVLTGRINSETILLRAL